jgi:hypothetical protein
MTHGWFRRRRTSSDKGNEGESAEREKRIAWDRCGYSTKGERSKVRQRRASRDGLQLDAAMAGQCARRGLTRPARAPDRRMTVYFIGFLPRTGRARWHRLSRGATLPER